MSFNRVFFHIINVFITAMWLQSDPDAVLLYLLVPMASISSMKTMEGACSSATRKSSRTSLGPSPRYFWISSEPTTRRNVADVWLATALARRVLPTLIRGAAVRRVFYLIMECTRHAFYPLKVTVNAVERCTNVRVNTFGSEPGNKMN